MSDNNKKLYIGLDVGTDSVGWAATDENYHLYRLKGKTAWGARLFDAAKSAAERRGKRTARRRLARRRERIRILNSLFQDILKNTDCDFLTRLSYSWAHDEDKDESIRSKGILFGSKQKEKDFYKKYPTIWHLRRDLIDGDGDEKKKEHAYSDVRYLYLAIHHIIKYRGNFLKDGDVNAIGEFPSESLKKLNDLLKNMEGDNAAGDILPESSYQEVKDILDNDENKTTKKNSFKKLFKGADKDNKLVEMFYTLAVGGEFDTKKLVSDSEIESKKINFNGKYDEIEDEVKGILSEIDENYVDVLDIAKELYDYAYITKLIGNNKYLSKAFVAVYKEHAKDLEALKGICKEIDKAKGCTQKEESIYYQIFCKKEKGEENDYPQFVHHDFTFTGKRPSIEDFNKFIKDKITPKNSPNENIDYLSEDSKKTWEKMKKKLDENQLLEIIANKSTSIIPMQLHKTELEIILDTAIKKGIPGFTEDLKEKIISLFNYKIPYYYGPLSGEHSNVVYKEDASKETILPWNIEEKVDDGQTKAKFMTNLVNECTYLRGKKVLPKISILYQDYDAFNKLNSIKVNDEPLSNKDKHDVFWNLCVTKNKTTMTDIQKYLKGKYQCKLEDVRVKGLSPNDAIACTTRNALREFYPKNDKGEFLFDRNSKEYKDLEEALKIKACFVDSPKDAKSELESKGFNDALIKAINKIPTKGWGTLSKELLILPNADENGIVVSHLIDILYDTSENFMQVLHDKKYLFEDKIKELNDKYFTGNNINSKDQKVDEIIDTLPPKMRRSTIQAVRIVKEICKVAKKDSPDEISIEVTREEDVKKKGKLTKSRKEQIEAFLKNLKGDESQAKLVLEELNTKVDETKLQNKHLYLYFLQNGKDAYTGESIDINDVLNGNKYDTDHIIPQSYIKDDSLDNLVLVERVLNQRRKDRYPLPSDIIKDEDRSTVERLWKMWKAAGSMTDKKYDNLTRKTKLTEEELSGFVNAQINVVNHSNKAIKDILKVLYPNVKPIFSKAHYPSCTRQWLEIPKLRDLNDTHHAVDAYLNIVCGVILNKHFGDMRVIKARLTELEFDNENKNNDSKTLNMEKYLHRQLFISKDEKERTKLGTLIDETSQRHDFLLTYRFNYLDSKFYDATVYPKDEKGKLIPTKENLDVKKYGGYDCAVIEYNCVATIKGEKESRYLVGVPHLYMMQYKNSKNKDEVLEKIKALVPHEEGDVVTVDLEHPLPLKSTVEIKGWRYLLLSSNQNQIKLAPITPIFLTRDSEKYLYQLNKLVEKGNSKEEGVKSNASKILNSTEDSITIYTDKFKQNPRVYSREKAMKIYYEIAEKAKQDKINGISMFKKLCTDNNDMIKDIQTETVQKQYDALVSAFSRFTRNSKADYKPIRLFINKAKITIVNQSITGLYESKKEL